MLKMHDALANSASSNAWVVQEYSNITIAITGTWNSAVATVQFSPDYPNVAWTNAATGGSTVTLTATNNIQNLEVGGGMWFRVTTASGDGSTDLDVWVSGDGVFPVS